MKINFLYYNTYNNKQGFYFSLRDKLKTSGSFLIVKYTLFLFKQCIIQRENVPVSNNIYMLIHQIDSKWYILYTFQVH